MNTSTKSEGRQHHTENGKLIQSEAHIGLTTLVTSIVSSSVSF